MSVQQQQRPSAAPQVAPPAAEQQQAPAKSEEPEWDYALSAGNSMVLSLIAGGVAADDEAASGLLHGTTDVDETQTAAPEAGETAAPAAETTQAATPGAAPAADVSTTTPAPPAPATSEAAPAVGAPSEEELAAAPKAQPVAPATTNPGGTLSDPFKKHQKQVPAAKITLTASQKAEIKLFQDNWVKNKGRYQNVAAKTGVPAELIAAIHYRESSLSFNKYLHQGDPLGKKAVNVPSNIPIFYDWDEAAVHALNMKKGIRDGLSMTEDTTDEVAMAAYSEAYNGLGYYNRDKKSPYVYAGTDQYTGGMYVADHKFSNVAKDRRLGTLALTRSIDENGATDVHSGEAQDKRSAAQVWGAVLAGHILRRGQNGREVEELQKRLGLGVDGNFGPGTDKAVKAFQQGAGLEPDGVVGVDTASAIDKKSPAPAPEAPAATPGASTTAPPASGPVPPAPPAPSSGPATAPPAPTTQGPAPATQTPAPPATTGPTTAPSQNAPTPTSPGEAAPAVIPAPPEWAQLLAGRLTLERGAAGVVVKYLQSQLLKAGFTLDIDGDFGPATMRAIKAFQKAKGLGVDGIVGKKTAGALG